MEYSSLRLTLPLLSQLALFRYVASCGMLEGADRFRPLSAAAAGAATVAFAVSASQKRWGGRVPRAGRLIMRRSERGGRSGALSPSPRTASFLLRLSSLVHRKIDKAHTVCKLSQTYTGQ